MKKESSYMLIVGIVVGILAMLFISFQLQLSNVQKRTAQLEQTVGSNTQAVSQIVNFINQSTGAGQDGQVPQTPPTE
jgi:cell division protein FtsL